MRRILFYITFFIFVGLVHLAVGQESNGTVPDDTIHVKQSRRTSDLEGPVTYEAQIIDNDMDARTTDLIGNASITYLDMTLKAEKISVDWDESLMIAEGVWETVWSVGANGDSVRVPKLKGAPQFVESGDAMTGERMLYNFKSRKGRVFRGRTSFEDGFYNGNAIKMPKPKILHVSDAHFTTCDEEDCPHYHFQSSKMKMKINDKLVAKPVVLYIGKIPLLALPFAYFPIEKGRHSGILFPRYGVSDREGRYLKGLGYYWAASQYWDATGRVDYFEKSGFLYRGDLRYKVRYQLSGSISGSITRKNFKTFDENDIVETPDQRWDLRIQHQQTLSPTMNLSVNGTFMSSKDFYKRLSGSAEQRMRKEMRSNATLTKRFGGSRSMTMNLSQVRNLETDEITETLPQISFRAGQTNLVPKPKAGKGKPRWYHNFYLSYNSNLNTQHTKTLKTTTDSSFIEKRQIGVQHDLTFSSPQKMFGWLTFNPTLAYKEKWADRTSAYTLNEETGEVESEINKGFAALRTFTSSANFSTKMYGVFRPPATSDIILRHVVQPNVSFSFNPDFSDEKWGYYEYIQQNDSTVFKGDRFSGSLYSTPSGDSKRMSFGVQNLFQMKIGDGEEAKKLDLFNLNFSSSYNWKAKEFKLGDLTSRFQASPARQLNLNVTTTHSFYQMDEDGRAVNQLIVDDIERNSLSDWFEPFARLTRINANVSLRLKGEAKGGTQKDEEETETEPLESLSPFPGDRLDMEPEISGFNIPWNLSTTFNFTESRSNVVRKTFYARNSLDFNLTPKWKIAYSSQFDFVKKEFVSQTFTFKRDLHCWEGQVVWTPTGYNKRFYLVIRVKSTMLRDIKYEKRTGRSGIY